MEDKKRIKISYVIPSSEIGGTEKMLMTMLESLPADIFYPPVVFTIKGKGRFTEELKKMKVNAHIFNLKKNPFQFLKLLKTIKEEHSDILHSFLFYGNLTGRLCGRLLKIKVVISSQRSADAWRKKYHWLIDRITSGWTDIIISNSHSGKNALVKKAGIDPSKISVIPNGIKKSDILYPLSKEDFGITPEELIVGTVGNLRKSKGHIYIIKAAEIVLKKLPDTRFVIVGEGQLRQKLIKETEKAGIADRFIFTGFIKDAVSVIHLFDIFVFPSLWEGCPVSLLEAMSEGKPCIAFSSGDIPYIIEDGKSGLLIPVAYYEKLASDIIKLAMDKNLRETVSENAKKRVEEFFSFDRMMQEYISVYKKTVAIKTKNR